MVHFLPNTADDIVVYEYYPGSGLSSVQVIRQDSEYMIGESGNGTAIASINIIPGNEAFAETIAEATARAVVRSRLEHKYGRDRINNFVRSIGYWNFVKAMQTNTMDDQISGYLNPN